ncbi:nucleolin [Selaginella moellendorffii]|nr:nucleolin [Selaginella moellendorffii]XP_002982064.2 nucleolin [Selaginella moellendorffii]|eukprot:XP_002966457.2 nucleolin [Selaginella moellendorffii]
MATTLVSAASAAASALPLASRNVAAPSTSMPSLVWVCAPGRGLFCPCSRWKSGPPRASRSRCEIRSMAPDEEKMTKRSPLDFPIEWDRPAPGRRPDIFPQFSPMKAPLPPPLPCDPPEEDEDEEEEKEEEEEEEKKEKPEKEPEKPKE